MEKKQTDSETSSSSPVESHAEEDDVLLPEWARKLKKLVKEVEAERKNSPEEITSSPKSSNIFPDVLIEEQGDKMKGQITLSMNQFKELHETVQKLEGILETVEIVSDKKLLASIRRSDADVRKGRVRKLNGIEEMKKW